MIEMEYHPIANLFPMMTDAEMSDLCADMKAHGYDQTAPIILMDGKILDGRNRQAAADKLDITPAYIEFEGSDPLAFVIRHNLHRRHLNESQRAVIASRLANMPNGGWRGNQWQTANMQTATPNITQADAAGMMNISPRMVASVKEIEMMAPERISEIERGGITVTKVHREVKRDAVKREVTEFPSDKYRVIYADPPWAYNDKCDDGAVQAGGSERHYPAMTLANLCALPIHDLTDANSVLFLWATSPMLPEALTVATAWGFHYKANFIWDKVKHNMGHYNSVRHELLLICTRGSCLPDSRELIDSVQSIERTEHSVKPEEFRTIIDKLYPGGKRIELFARRKVDGWDTWGNEVV